MVESEARDTRLDRASGSGGTPASQILRYLALAEPASGGGVRWGLLTNGRTWRLYWHGARSRAEGFVGFDLPAILDGVARSDAAATDQFRTFLLLFRRAAFDPTGPSGATFLDTALAEGRRYEERITAALSDAVFKRVFRPLVQTIAAHDPQRKDALFFLLYGLDRDAARYILSTFPIVREEEEARYQGRFRSRDLIEVVPGKSDRCISLVCSEKDGPDGGQTEALRGGFQGEGCS